MFITSPMGNVWELNQKEVPCTCGDAVVAQPTMALRLPAERPGTPAGQACGPLPLAPALVRLRAGVPSFCTQRLLPVHAAISCWPPGC